MPLLKNKATGKFYAFTHKEYEDLQSKPGMLKAFEVVALGVVPKEVQQSMLNKKAENHVEVQKHH